ncbi:MAG TPA: helix-turn-helix transcriptional regulator [Streptosporangiaceae bacterium]|nr:helix-turn-helix transcriptional regulator [Streptosporangiaceae bacterium]
MRRRRLAAELQRLRTASRRTLEEVADYLECSPAKISRIENGQVTVRIQDARDLLDLYSVEGDRREVLLQMVRQSRSKGWWSPYADLLDEGAQTLLSLEDEASAILIYETNLVTALLQTRSYAWEMLSAWHDVRLDLVQRKVELKMARQQILTRTDGPPRLDVVLDESSLRRTVGTPDVMSEQYLRLVAAADQANVTLRVLPFEAGSHQAMGFPFQIFEFAGDDPHIVFVELLSGSECFESAEEVGRYRAAFNQVSDRALDPARSRRFIELLAASAGRMPRSS